VKSLRIHPAARALTVICLMISWFIATNHCALGLMTPTVQAEAEHSHCHGGKTAPGKGKPADDGTRECCKSIHGTLVPAKAEAKFDAAKFQMQLFVRIQVLAPVSAERVVGSSVYDHGPPRVVSFAESVLQRSLLGHAPPFAV